MPNALKHLRIGEVSLVDAGANPGANVLIWKRRDGPPQPSGDPPVKKHGGKPSLLQRVLKTLGLIIEVPEETPNTFTEELEERNEWRQWEKVESEVWTIVYAMQDVLLDAIKSDLAAADKQTLIDQSLEQFTSAVTQAVSAWITGEPVNKAGRAIAGHRMARLRQAKDLLRQVINEAEPPQPGDGQNNVGKKGDEGQVTQQIDKSKLPPEVQAYIEDLEKKAAAGEPASGGAPQGADEDILKNLPESVRKVVEDARKEAAEARKQAEDAQSVAKAEREARVMAEFTKRAEALTHLPAKPEDFAKVLKSLHEAAPEAFAAVEKVLQGANEALKQSDLFREVGKGGSGTGGSAMAEIEAVAAELQKADPQLTREQAIEKVMNQRPDLVKKYREEVR